MTEDQIAAAVREAELILNDRTLHVCIDGLTPEQQVEQLMDALAMTTPNPPTLFIYGNSLVRIRHEPDGAVLLEPLGWIGLRTELVARIALVHRKVSKATGAIVEKPYWPPPALVRLLFAHLTGSRGPR